MVYIMLAEGFEEAEVIVPLDLMRRAGIEVALLGLDDAPVRSAHGVTMLTDLTLDAATTDGLQMLFLPGGRGGVDEIQMNLFAMAFVQSAWDCGAYLAAICAGPTILARIGLSDRRAVVCYPGMEEEMGSAVVQRGQRVVVDGHMVTGEAAGSSFAFALQLVTLLKGKAAAEKVRQEIHFHG